MEKQVILIDDHELFRQGLKNCIEQNSDWKVIKDAGDFAGAGKISLELAMENLENRNIIAIIDLSFKNIGQSEENLIGFEIAKVFRKNAPFVKCLILSSFDSCGYVEKALSAEVGALGYVSKSADKKTIVLALETVSKNQKFIQQELVSNLLQLKDLYSSFTNKEREVADLITATNTNAEIAEKMNIKVATVDNYISRLYDKTGTTSRTELLRQLGR